MLSQPPGVGRKQLPRWWKANVVYQELSKQRHVPPRLGWSRTSHISATIHGSSYECDFWNYIASSKIEHHAYGPATAGQTRWWAGISGSRIWISFYIWSWRAMMSFLHEFLFLLPHPSDSDYSQLELKTILKPWTRPVGSLFWIAYQLNECVCLSS